MTDQTPLRFRITDQREEAIRARADESVVWSEDEARVSVRISDALWAACRDRRTLLETLDRERAAQPAPLDERYRALVKAAHEVDRTHHTDSPAAYPAEMSDHIRRGNAALLALRAALAALEPDR